MGTIKYTTDKSSFVVICKNSYDIDAVLLGPALLTWFNGDTAMDK